MSDGRALVEAARIAARAHAASWEALVPDRFAVNVAAEAGEEAAFDDMAAVKALLRAHIEATYGVSIEDLTRLATI
jgi:hypothetical protein